VTVSSRNETLFVLDLVLSLFVSVACWLGQQKKPNVQMNSVRRMSACSVNFLSSEQNITKMLIHKKKRVRNISIPENAFLQECKHSRIRGNEFIPAGSGSRTALLRRYVARSAVLSWQHFLRLFIY
jgi:hypothetical protein